MSNKLEKTTVTFRTLVYLIIGIATGLGIWFGQGANITANGVAISNAVKAAEAHEKLEAHPKHAQAPHVPPADFKELAQTVTDQGSDIRLVQQQVNQNGVTLKAIADKLNVIPPPSSPLP